MEGSVMFMWIVIGVVVVLALLAWVGRRKRRPDRRTRT